MSPLSAPVLVADMENMSTSFILCCMPAIIREDHYRIPLFFEKWVQRYIESDFYQLFRMTRVTYNKLTQEIGQLETVRKPHAGGRLQVPLEKCVLATLWYLGKSDTFISIADRFNIAPSTACVSIHEVVKKIVILKSKYIVWPKEEECKSIATHFYNICKYPGIIGVIDGCHINCKVPIDQDDSYQDRKLNHSVSLQAVCVHTKIFTNICAGFPGSLHDARVLRESFIGQAAENNYKKWFYDDTYHLLGDSAYPLKIWLMKPYRQTRALSNQQRFHNRALSGGRVYIENAFGLLKGRWRILQYINVYSIEMIVDIIAACCVLHNFCLIENDEFNEICNDQCPVSDERSDSSCMPDVRAVTKRNTICNTF